MSSPKTLLSAFTGNKYQTSKDLPDLKTVLSNYIQAQRKRDQKIIVKGGKNIFGKEVEGLTSRGLTELIMGMAGTTPTGQILKTLGLKTESPLYHLTNFWNARRILKDKIIPGWLDRIGDSAVSLTRDPMLRRVFPDPKELALIIDKAKLKSHLKIKPRAEPAFLKHPAGKYEAEEAVFGAINPKLIEGMKIFRFPPYNTEHSAQVLRRMSQMRLPIAVNKKSVLDFKYVMSQRMSPEEKEALLDLTKFIDF